MLQFKGFIKCSTKAFDINFDLQALKLTTGHPPELLNGLRLLKMQTDGDGGGENFIWNEMHIYNIQ